MNRQTVAALTAVAVGIGVEQAVREYRAEELLRLRGPWRRMGGGRGPTGRGVGRGRGFHRRGGALTLEAQIIAAYEAVGWTVFFLGLSRDEDDFVLVGSAVDTWIDRSGLGNDALQPVGAARPTFGLTAINGLPGFTLDGGDWLLTGGIAIPSAVAYATHQVVSVTGGGTRFLTEWGAFVGTTVRPVALGTNAYRADGKGNVGLSQALSDTSLTLTTPAVVRNTFDTTLATLEAKIWHNGVDIGDTQPADADNATGLVSGQAITIGAAAGGGSFRMSGAIGAQVNAAGPSTLPLAAAAEVDALLAAQWAI